MSEVEGGPSTLIKIYLWCVEQRRPVGPREVMRVFGMGSPSTAYYYLNRLVQLGLLERRAGEYVVVRRINIEGFFWVGNKLVPKLLVYSTFFIGLSISYLIAVIRNIIFNQDFITLIPPLLISTLASGIMLYEGFKALSKLKVKK